MKRDREGEGEEKAGTAFRENSIGITILHTTKLFLLFSNLIILELKMCIHTDTIPITICIDRVREPVHPIRMKLLGRTNTKDICARRVDKMRTGLRGEQGGVMYVMLFV